MKSKDAVDWLREERRARQAGYKVIGGVDEVGRGPLAGPVVAACVVLPGDDLPPKLGDSKSLTPSARREVFHWLLHARAHVGVGLASVAEIDSLNILRATHLAMARAVLACPGGVDFALVDGLRVAGLPIPHLAVVKGDATCASIAAASIVAKVVRDELMKDLDRRFPGYNFATNCGYPTPDHLEALCRLGPCPHHRATFRPVRESVGNARGLPMSVKGTTSAGGRGEDIARTYLERIGHRILATGYRANRCEIDIISLEGKTLVFTEVKTTRSRTEELPAGRLTQAQQKRIAAAATAYLAEAAPPHGDCRFDVIAVRLGSRAPALQHYRGAFLLY